MLGIVIIESISRNGYLDSHLVPDRLAYQFQETIEYVHNQFVDIIPEDVVSGSYE